jgi:hypothetical protein
LRAIRPRETDAGDESVVNSELPLAHSAVTDKLWRMSHLAVARNRIRAAYGVAVATDVLQLALGPLGWILADEILDVIAMILISRLIGFHPLLLPTFVLELLPVADLLPTWTGCVALVVMLRKKHPTSTPPLRHGPVIDV